MIYRDATLADLPTVVAMLAEEQIGGRADDPSEPLDSAYLAAFDAIDRDPNQRLIVAELDGAIIGTMQLSCLPGLINRGAWRGQIEAVRIASDKRSLGLGAAMIGWAVERFRERGCFMAQLTSNNDRIAAHRFYERLGWKKSHSGFKLYLTKGD
jgi:GNAT superfamily N-acetyltransferase